MSDIITDYESLELILDRKSKTGVSIDQDLVIKILGYVKSLISWGADVNKDDSIAIARHFYSQLETVKEKNAFLDEITGGKV